MIYNMSELVFERDKRNACAEMRDYFFRKNRQEQAWNIITAMMNSLQQRVFSNVEAQRITAFLSKKPSFQQQCSQSYRIFSPFCDIGRYSLTLPFEKEWKWFQKQGLIS